MKKIKRPESKNEVMRKRWERHITHEKNYSPDTAKWMSERLEGLLDYLLYGHAVIAYYKQNGEFCFVKATLIYYRADFRKEYDPEKVKSTVVYWNIEQQGWKTFQIENFLEWRPI